MKSWKRWSTAVAIGATTAALGVAAFNMIIDPYSVFKTNEGMRTGYTPNERYRKIDFLKRNIGRYDSFVLGASTMGLFELDELKKARPDGHWYNLSFLSGTPAEALRALKYLKAQGTPIKEVVYGIDMFAFRQISEYRELWRQEYPEIKGVSWYTWWKKHVFASTLVDGVERLTHNWMNDQPRVVFDMEGSGGFSMVRWDREIAKDDEAFIAKQLGGKPDQKAEAAEITLIEARFDELRELKRWLDENGVVSHFWINPMHWRQMATVHRNSMEAYRRSVFEAVGLVPDYTTRSDICGVDANWYELQHFRRTIAAKVIQEVLMLNREQERKGEKRPLT